MIKVKNPTLTAKRVLDYLFDNCDFDFERVGLQDEPFAILAGGSVANAIANIVKHKKVRINDFDVFVYRQENILDDSIVTVDEEDTVYPRDMVKRLQITGRFQDDHTDYIYMDVLDKYQYAVQDLTPQEFYNTVLGSFDLNCVQAGIYWDQETKQYELLVSEDFIDFLYTDKIQVVNVHSIVTIARLIKKQYDLGSALDLDTELKVISLACNPDNLKRLSEEQESKHGVISLVIPQLTKQLYERDQEMQALYDAFSNLGEYNHRQIKIRIIRAYLSGSKSQKEVILDILNNAPGTYIKAMVTTRHILSWIGDKDITEDELSNVYINFPYEFSVLYESLFARFTLHEIVELSKIEAHTLEERLRQKGLLNSDDKLFIVLNDLRNNDIWGWYE